MEDSGGGRQAGVAERDDPAQDPLGKLTPFLKYEDPPKKSHNPLHWILKGMFQARTVTPASYQWALKLLFSLFPSHVN